MRIELQYKCGYKTAAGYRHFPLLYFAFKRGSFGLSILGIVFKISW